MPLTGLIADTHLVKTLSLLIHDLRAPLSVAHGYLRLVQDDQLSSAAVWASSQTIGALTAVTLPLAECPV